MDTYEIIELVRKSAIDIITQHQLHSQPFFSAGDVIALVAIVGAVIMTIMSNKASRKNSISNSRIEWIQNVRQSSAKFISACYEVMTVNNANGNDAMLSELREKAHLLILYFGPEETKKTVELLCETSNSGKNKQIY